jgi:hypothetical protein
MRSRMPDAWEQQYAAFGLDPGVFDANGTQLSLLLPASRATPTSSAT